MKFDEYIEINYNYICTLGFSSMLIAVTACRFSPNVKGLLDIHIRIHWCDSCGKITMSYISVQRDVNVHASNLMIYDRIIYLRKVMVVHPSNSVLYDQCGEM